MTLCKTCGVALLYGEIKFYGGYYCNTQCSGKWLAEMIKKAPMPWKPHDLVQPNPRPRAILSHRKV